MKSPSISSQNRKKNAAGITMIEIMLVMGMLSVVAGFSISLSMDSYRGYAFRGSRDMLISVLQKARSQSINNICLGSPCSDGKPHGVHFESGSYVIFQGSTWAGRDIALDEIIQIESGALVISGADIVFSQLSGDASPSGATITVSDAAGRSSLITFNSEGRIIWTN